MSNQQADLMWRPDHAYIPGQTARHAEGLFDPLKTGLDKTPAKDLHFTTAWQIGRAFFAEGYFWEAHEMWEAVWLAAPPNSAEKLLVQAFIQTANAGLKRKMGQQKAADRLAAQALHLHHEAFLSGKSRILGSGREELGNIIHNL